MAWRSLGGWQAFSVRELTALLYENHRLDGDKPANKNDLREIALVSQSWPAVAVLRDRNQTAGQLDLDRSG
jgi:hypothetical protein